uniref:Uncharacterized protein LOC114331317 n=1 Tax=Diabrotica virgifera virgifera TaxID=50390 RepID=A0A6P7FUP2_DIAVI
MKRCQILIVCVFWLKTSISTPVQDEYSAFNTFQDVILRNEEIESLNEPLLSLHNANPDLTSICWAESLIITENKHTKNQTISKAYSILLDTPGNLQDLPANSENSSCYEVLEQNTDQKKVLNFTTVKESGDYIIKEHKTLFCGAGPILSHHFIVWPKLKRKQIEISINPLGKSNLRNCSDIEDSQQLESEDTNKMLGERTRSVADEDEIVGSQHTPNKEIPQEESALPYPIPQIKHSHSNEDVFEEEVTTKKIGAMHGNKETVVAQASPPDNKSNKKQGLAPTVKNSLLMRDINCTVDELGVCKYMIEKGKNCTGSANSSKIVLGKWFFPDVALAEPLDKERTFILNIKLIVNLKENTTHNYEGSMEDDIKNKETELVVEEECLYVIPKKNKAKRWSKNIPKN